MRGIKTWYKERRQSGDTIVEVLIAISIVSLVLTSAYMVTSKNSQTMRAVQERTQAQKLVERQIEFLRAATTTSQQRFCFADEEGVATTTLANCVFDQNGTSRNNDGSVQYTIVITPNNPKTDTFQIKATWDRLGGGSGNVTMYYYEKKT